MLVSFGRPLSKFALRQAVADLPLCLASLPFPCRSPTFLQFVVDDGVCPCVCRSSLCSFVLAPTHPLGGTATSPHPLAALHRCSCIVVAGAFQASSRSPGRMLVRKVALRTRRTRRRGIRRSVQATSWSSPCRIVKRCLIASIKRDGVSTFRTKKGHMLESIALRPVVKHSHINASEV